MLSENSPRSLGFSLLFVLTFSLGSLANCQEAASSTSAGTTAYVYVDIGIPGTTNTNIYAWAAEADGTLTPVSGSPHSGNAASYIGVAHKFLFGTAQGSVAAWKIHSDGSLTGGSISSTPPEGTAETGPLSLSFDLTHQDLYANYSLNGTYQAYAIGPNGRLTFVDYVDADESSSWLSFTANNAMAYQTDCYHGNAAMWGYTRSSTGSLTVTYDPIQPPQPTGLSSGGYCPWGAATIGNSNVIIAEQPSNDESPTGPYQMVTFSIASDGSLSTTDTASTAPTATVGNVVDYHFDAKQKWLAVTGTTGIQIFEWKNGKLTAASTYAIPNGARYVRWDKAGHLFVLSSNVSNDNDFQATLYVFNVVKGVPTAASGSPVTLTGIADGLAVKTLRRMQ